VSKLTEVGKLEMELTLKGFQVKRLERELDDTEKTLFKETKQRALAEMSNKVRA
jgi:hypothetical protein